MPLPDPAVPRRRAHTRRIELEGFVREDGLYELDAASRTGVDNVREEIINSVNFDPDQGRRPRGSAIMRVPP